MTHQDTERLMDEAMDLLDRGDLAGAVRRYRQVCEVDVGNGEAWLMQGAILGELGDVSGAVECLRKAVEIDPGAAEARCTLGNALRLGGDVPGALEQFREAVRLDPGHAQAWQLLGGVEGMQGNFTEAERCCRQAVQLQPDSLDAQMNLANTLQQLGRLEEAAAGYRAVVAKQPNLAPAWLMLGRTYMQMEDLAHAEECCRETLQLAPEMADAHLALGVALKFQGRLDEAIDTFRQAVSLNPRLAETHYYLGNALLVRGRPQEAIAAFRQAIGLHPDAGDFHAALGMALQSHGSLQDAILAYQKSLELAPDVAATHNNLSYAYKLLGNLDAAEASLRRALRLDPVLAEAHNNLGGVLQGLGRVEEAVDCFRRALELKPDFPGGYSNFLLALNYLADCEPEIILNEHRAWARICEGRHPQIDRHTNSAEPAGRLRVGYVSPDLRVHPVASFIEPVFSNRDPAQFEIFCYAEVSKPDAVTERLRAMVQGWRNTCGLSDEQVADLVRDDGIDILVDLAGHTGNNRLPVFARKPAPIQVSCLGYPSTTGLSAMDYLLTDTVCDQRDDGRFYSENLHFLPNGFSCYQPPTDAPEISPLPANKTGFVTFASFSHLAKINAKVLDLWCRVLEEVPSSQMLVYRHLLKGSAREWFYREFERRGIAGARVSLLSDIPMEYQHLPYGKRYMGLLERVDVALDTFPWSGHTTSCEMLWMGVPVITLLGDRHAGRTVASVLTSLGLQQYIAKSPDDYVAISKTVATDLEGLARLRAGLRSRMRAAPLCNGVAFTKDLENAYREMWRNWCATANCSLG